MKRHEGVGGRLEPGLLAWKKSPTAIGILRGPQEIEAGGERVAHYNWTGPRNSKLRRVSTGMLTCFLPVKTAPSVPAPAPAPAPISAPAGPPATAPIPAPAPAPPPMMMILRFLCEPLTRPACDVEIRYFLPFSSKASSSRVIAARPFNLPEALEVSTRPEKFAPRGMIS